MFFFFLQDKHEHYGHVQGANKQQALSSLGITPPNSGI